MAAVVRSGRAHPLRAVVLVVCLAVGLVVTACGDDGDDGASTTSAPVTSRTTATTAPTSTTTTTSSSSTTQSPRDRWVGVTWEPDTGDPTKPAVGGKTVGLTSVVGMCQGADCAFGLDLLTTAEVTGAPPAGPYLLWSSRSVDHRSDGSPIWQIVDVADVTLAEGETTLSCTPVGQPESQALGIASGALPEGGSVTPDRVYVADAEGSIRTPDPAGYTCEVGQD